MPIYTCQKCDKEFPNKGDYTRHINRKIDCSGKTLEEKINEKVAEVVDEKVAEVVEELIEEKAGKSKNKDTTSLIMNLVDNLHNVLRKDAIIGSDAYHDINKLLFLRFIQPCVTTTLTTLVDPEMYTEVEDFDESVFEYLKDLNKLVIISDLNEFEKEVKILYKRILGTHPLTREIFNKNDYFKAKAKTLRTCLQKIVKTINDEDFDNLNSDIKGLIYEHFLNGYADKGGKEFGQFFTPRNLINLIMKLNNEVFDDIKEKTLKTVYDPCMGTAGFLTEAYKYLKNNTVQENKTDENKSIDIKLHGTELEPKTYASGIMNVLLTTGGIHSVQCKNSLHDNKLIEFDWIVTNPPFGVKEIKYNEILQSGEHEAKPNSMIRGQKIKKQKKTNFEMTELYPIKTNDCSALFLQHCIKKLKNNGICNIVLPDGQLTNSKTSIKLRKYLVDECDLKAVLTIPNGTFKHAGVATIVLFFSKQEEIRTSEVKFYTAVDNCSEHKLLCVVDNETLEQNKYVLNYKNYMPKEERKARGNAELKTLGEVCELVKGKKHNVSDGSDEGKYPLLCSSKLGKVKYLDTFDYKDPHVVIGTGGTANVHLYEKFSISTDMKILKQSEQIRIKYLYCYLFAHLNELNELYKGSTIKHISVDDLLNFQIPVPDLEAQDEIIADCEVMEESKRLSLMQIENIKKIIDIYNRTQIKTLFDLQTDNENKPEVKALGEICQINIGFTPSTKDASLYDNNGYVWISIADMTNFYIGNSNKKISKQAVLNKTDKLVKKGNVLFSFKLSIGKVGIAAQDLYTNEAIASICSNDESILLNKYIAYYLLLQDFSQSGNGCIGNGSMNKTSVSNIQIPVPSLDVQKEIINKYEENQAILNKYVSEIENIKKYITDIENLRKELF